MKMDEYIKRDDAIDAMWSADFDVSEATGDIYGHKYGFSHEAVCEVLENVPAVDVVAVVHCKGCLYWQDNNGGYPAKACRWRKDETPDADDFCSCGERKGGDGNG